MQKNQPLLLKLLSYLTENTFSPIWKSTLTTQLTNFPVTFFLFLKPENKLSPPNCVSAGDTNNGGS